MGAEKESSDLRKLIQVAKKIQSIIPVTSERLVIRKYMEKDIEWYYRYGLEDSLYRFMVEKTKLGYVEVKNGIACMIANYKSNYITRYVISEMMNERMIGGISLYPRINNNAIEVEIGYWLGSEYRGLGYGTEVINSMLSKVRELNVVDSIVMNIMEHNIRSIKIADKAGFKVDSDYMNGDDRIMVYKAGGRNDKGNKQ